MGNRGGKEEDAGGVVDEDGGLHKKEVKDGFRDGNGHVLHADRRPHPETIFYGYDEEMHAGRPDVDDDFYDANPALDEGLLESWVDKGVKPFKIGPYVITDRPFDRLLFKNSLPVRPREILMPWTGHIFACFDDGATCCLTCFCPFVQFGLNSRKLGMKECHFCGKKVRSWLFGSCIFQALIWILVPIALMIPFYVGQYYACPGEFGWPFDTAGPFDCTYWWINWVGRIPPIFFFGIYGGYFRMRMRLKYSLPPDEPGENVYMCLLCPCAICQEARTHNQIERRKILRKTLRELADEEAGGVHLKHSYSQLAVGGVESPALNAPEPMTMVERPIARLVQGTRVDKKTLKGEILPFAPRLSDVGIDYDVLPMAQNFPSEHEEV